MDSNYNRILNLLRFNICMHMTNFRISDSTLMRNATLLKHDPSYILEKYNHWVGFTPMVAPKSYTPDDMTDFFHAYYKRWGSSSDSVRGILMYLFYADVNITKMFLKFEEYIGPFDMICSDERLGLHGTLEGNVNRVAENNYDNIKVILRDLRLRSLL